jgi:Ca2+/H+ antiporter
MFRGPRRWVIPLVAGFACIVASSLAGAVVTWILLMAGFVLLLDGVTAAWERAGGTGNLKTYRQ